MGYSILISDPRSPVVIKVPTNSTSFCFKSSHYDHLLNTFNGYLNHDDFFMSHEHVLKKLTYCLIYTYVVLWILSCVQLSNTCSKLTLKHYINLLNVFKVKNNYSMTLFWRFYCWLWPEVNIVFLLLTLIKGLPGCEFK